MQEQHASLQPSIDCLTSRKTLQARTCNPKERKKINGENERNKLMKLLSLHHLRPWVLFLHPFGNISNHILKIGWQLGSHETTT